MLTSTCFVSSSYPVSIVHVGQFVPDGTRADGTPNI